VTLYGFIHVLWYCEVQTNDVYIMCYISRTVKLQPGDHLHGYKVNKVCVIASVSIFAGLNATVAWKFDVVTT